MRSKLEMPVNLAASVASMAPVSMLLGAEQGVQGAQTKQIDQQTYNVQLLMMHLTS